MTIPACPTADDDLALRAVLGVARSRSDDRRAERAFLQATQDLTLCGAAAWERMRQEGTTAEKLYVELQHTRLLLREARGHAEILAARLEKVGPRRRPHYSAPLRFQILEHRKRSTSSPSRRPRGASLSLPRRSTTGSPRCDETPTPRPSARRSSRSRQ